MLCNRISEEARGCVYVLYYEPFFRQIFALSQKERERKKTVLGRPVVLPFRYRHKEERDLVILIHTPNHINEKVSLRASH